MTLFLRPMHLALPAAGWAPSDTEWCVIYREGEREFIVGSISQNTHTVDKLWGWSVGEPVVPGRVFRGEEATRLAAMAAFRSAWERAVATPGAQWHPRWKPPPEPKKPPPPPEG